MAKLRFMLTFFPLVATYFLLLTGAPYAADYVFPDTAGISAGRIFDANLLAGGDTLVVTMNLSSMEPDSLRNLYFSDHIPEAFFDISTIEVQVNGVVLSDTAYIHEVDSGGEIYANTVPHRWVIEAPRDSLGNRPCSQILDPSTGTLQIIYTARCTTLGNHYFPSYAWAGQLSGADFRETFGYCDSVFISIAGPPSAVVDLTTVLSGSNMFLFWSPVEAALGIDRYVVYRDTFPGFDSNGGDSIGITADTFFVDQAASGIGDPALNWYYLVRAVDLGGKKSDDSNRAGEFDAILDDSK